MINTTTYANAWAHLQSNKRSLQLYWFILFEDDNSNDYYFTDHPTQNWHFVPSYIEITPIIQKASLFEGSYTISPIHLKIENILQAQGDGTTARWHENFSSNEFETELCTIYLGYLDCNAQTDTVELYKGRMANFKYSVLSIEFDVVDRAIFELPNIPKNKFDLTNYPNVSKDLINMPIPIVYGRWDYEPTGTSHYGIRSFVPCYLIENEMDASTPKLKFEIADHGIDAINDLLIYDDKFCFY